MLKTENKWERDKAAEQAKIFEKEKVTSERKMGRFTLQSSLQRPKTAWRLQSYLHFLYSFFVVFFETTALPVFTRLVWACVFQFVDSDSTGRGKSN